MNHERMKFDDKLDRIKQVWYIRGPQSVEIGGQVEVLQLERGYGRLRGLETVLELRTHFSFLAEFLVCPHKVGY